MVTRYFEKTEILDYLQMRLSPLLLVLGKMSRSQRCTETNDCRDMR